MKTLETKNHNQFLVNQYHKEKKKLGDRTVKKLNKIRPGNGDRIASKPKFNEWELLTMRLGNITLNPKDYKVTDIHRGYVYLQDRLRRKVPIKPRSKELHYQRLRLKYQRIKGRKFIRLQGEQLVPLDLIPHAKGIE